MTRQPGRSAAFSAAGRILSVAVAIDLPRVGADVAYRWPAPVSASRCTHFAEAVADDVPLSLNAVGRSVSAA
jgi:hypothetical protein